MGFDVWLETEDRRQVEAVADHHDLLHRLLPKIDDTSFDFLRFIDPYGDTTFKVLQAGKFLSEWRRLYSKCEVAEETALLEQIEDLAKRLAGGNHLYLRFIGD
jgi:hypothetical protein